MRAHEFITPKHILREFFFFPNVIGGDPEKKRSVIELMKQLFGSYDAGNSDEAEKTVEDVLKNVDWKNSFAFFDESGACEAALLIANMDMITHLKNYNNPHMQPLIDTVSENKLSSIQGVALYIKPDFPTSKTLSAMRYIQNYARRNDIDFIFGLALAELNNMGFWKKHSIYLGQQMEDGVAVNIFAIPFNQRAKEILNNYSREYSGKNKLSEAPITNVDDPKNPTWGLTPYNKNAGYLGLRVMMKPSVFLSLALYLPDEHKNPHVERHIFSEPEGNIASPFLEIKMPAEWFNDPPDFLKRAKVVGHEGRNRMHAWLRKHGDDPVEVHLIPRGGLRRHELTDEIIKYLQSGLHSEDSTDYIVRPFTKVI